MASTLAARERDRAPSSDQTRRDAGAWVRSAGSVPLLIGVLLSFFGLAWDVQWHSDVGPDSFFTAPHLVLYSGTAIAGLGCLAVVLLTTWYARRGSTAAAEGTIGVLGGLFRTPAGFVLGGLGAASFLVYGGLDEWWHRIYGFDVTLISPPHVGLILSIFLTNIGALVVFAGEVGRATAHDRRGRTFWGPAVGFAVAATIMVAFITPTVLDALPWDLFGLIDWPGIVVAFLYPALLLAVASVVRRPGAALLPALALLALRTFSWIAAPALTAGYAAATGLFLRDTTDQEPVVAGMLPSFLVVAAVAVEAVLWVARRRAWPTAPSVAVAGLVAAVVLRLLEPTLAIYLPTATTPPAVRELIDGITVAVYWPTLALVPLVGALAGWFGWLVGVVLRRVAYAPAPSAAAAPAGARPAPAEAEPSWAG